MEVSGKFSYQNHYLPSLRIFFLSIRTLFSSCVLSIVTNYTFYVPGSNKRTTTKKKRINYCFKHKRSFNKRLTMVANCCSCLKRWYLENRATFTEVIINNKALCSSNYDLLSKNVRIGA